jgi:hypothetical protein
MRIDHQRAIPRRGHHLAHRHGGPDAAARRSASAALAACNRPAISMRLPATRPG